MLVLEVDTFGLLSVLLLWRCLARLALWSVAEHLLEVGLAILEEVRVLGRRHHLEVVRQHLPVQVPDLHLGDRESAGCVHVLGARVVQLLVVEVVEQDLGDGSLVQVADPEQFPFILGLVGQNLLIVGFRFIVAHNSEFLIMTINICDLPFQLLL